MKRGRIEVAGDILLKARENRRVAPSRITAMVGVSYKFLSTLISNGLIETEQLHGKAKTLKVTEKGHQFLNSYLVCIKLFPAEEAVE